FASLLRLVCRPAVALEEPELVARRKELQPERFGLRPDLHELVGLGGSRKLRRVLGEPAQAVVDLAKRQDVDALPRSVVLSRRGAGPSRSRGARAGSRLPAPRTGTAPRPGLRRLWPARACLACAGSRSRQPASTGGAGALSGA